VDISLLTSSLHLTVLIDFILIIISHYLIGVKEYLCFLSAERSADTGEAERIIPPTTRSYGLPDSKGS